MFLKLSLFLVKVSLTYYFSYIISFFFFFFFFFFLFFMSEKNTATKRLKKKEVVKKISLWKLRLTLIIVALLVNVFVIEL
jgi:hypothetical protein